MQAVKARRRNSINIDMKIQEITEGAEMIAYMRSKTDPKLFTFPDEYKDDESVELSLIHI